MLVRLGPLIMTVDFMVLEVGYVHASSKEHSILVDRPFMAIVNVMINVYSGKVRDDGSRRLDDANGEKSYLDSLPKMMDVAYTGIFKFVTDPLQGVDSGCGDVLNMSIPTLSEEIKPLLSPKHDSLVQNRAKFVLDYANVEMGDEVKMRKIINEHVMVVEKTMPPKRDIHVLTYEKKGRM